MNEAQMQRKTFSRQPARAVLVDFRPPMDSGTCLNMVQALTDTLMLASNLTGSCRIPLFSLIALGLYPEALYPLQSINGNRMKLSGALKELKSLCSSTLPASSRSCLSEGIDEALMQLRRQQSLNNSSNSTVNSQLEATIVTGTSSSTVAHQLSSLSNCPTLECVKRIQVLCVHEGERILSSEQEDELNLMEEDCFELLASLLDILPIENDVLSFQSVFQCWLHDCNMDSEHLSLLLPAATDGDEVTVRCDLYERIMDPVLLPASITNHYLLTASPDQTTTTTKQQTLVTTGHTEHVPIHKLRAVNLVVSGGVCESVLYGMPLIMMPTACWKLDWEELEANRDHFYSLCKLLKEKDQLLLACDVSTPPVGHYLILPSPSHSLLIKPVAVGELVLPIEVTQQVDNPSDAALRHLQDSLGKLQLMESYNPLLVTSQLSGVLSTMCANKRSGSGVKGGGVATAAKRKYQPPPLVQPHQQPVTRPGGGGARKVANSVKRPRGSVNNSAASSEPHPHRKGYAPLDSTFN